MTYTELSTFMSKPAPIIEKKPRHSTLRIYLILNVLRYLITSLKKLKKYTRFQISAAK